LTKSEGIIRRSKKWSIELVNKLRKKGRNQVRSKETSGERNFILDTLFCMAIQVSI
jgi:hypothetical protein